MALGKIPQIPQQIFEQMPPWFRNWWQDFNRWLQSFVATGGGSGTSGYSGYSGFSGISGVGTSGYSGYSGSVGEVGTFIFDGGTASTTYDPTDVIDGGTGF